MKDVLVSCLIVTPKRSLSLEIITTLVFIKIILAISGIGEIYDSRKYA
jgi:hypothetical protein